ncbi:MAG: PAS domain S-box protein, partial [Myxococcota bacterium]
MRKSRPTSSMAAAFRRDYLRISALPTLLLLTLVIIGSVASTNYSLLLMNESVSHLNDSAEQQLRSSGKDVVRTKARDVARQVEIYLRAHPDARLEELQHDPYFQSIAVQHVGQTGYTCLYEAETSVMRFHPNEELVDRPMRFLADSLPSWWEIFEPSLNGQETSGYYSWLEADGTVREKYMTMTPVGQELGGRQVMIAATTYMDEFLQPLMATRASRERASERYESFAYRQAFLVALGTAIVILLTLLAVRLLGRRATNKYIRPIETLAEAAARVGQGDWQREENAALLGRKDELGDLARAFRTMREQLSELVGRLEQRVDDLTTTRDALRRSEERYRGLFEGVPVGQYRTCPKGRFLAANPTLLEMLGFEDQEAISSVNARDCYVHPEDRERWQRSMEEHGVVRDFELQLRRTDGEVIWAKNTARIVRDDDGRVVCYEGTLEDISERKRTADALLRSERNLRSTLDSIGDGVIATDASGNVSRMNPIAEALTGWSSDEAKGRALHDVVRLADPESHEPILAALERVREEPQPTVAQRYVLVAKTGERRLVSERVSPIRDEASAIVGVVAVIRDVTEEARLQEQLLQARKMDSIGRLAGGIAHDFNNMLTGILGAAQLLQNPNCPDALRAKYSKLIQDTAGRAADLTQKLLAFSRKGRLALGPVDINDVIRGVVDILEHTIDRRIHLELELSRDRLVTVGDPAQLQNVVLNLAVNARDAMPQGGTLTIASSLCEVEQDDRGSVSSAPESGTYVRVRVSDTGTGMSDDVLDHVFEPFFTTKSVGKGTGLGLATAYGTVREHGGTIEVTSAPGKGSTFDVYLPAD